MEKKWKLKVNQLFWHILPALLTALILGLVFFCFGLYPFGEKSAAWGDMKQQVVPLMLEWKDILSGRAGFFYNLNNAGGMSFFGVFFFFLSSPFTFLTVFIDKSYLYEFINLLILLKLALSAGTVSCFFRYAEPKLNHMLHSFLCISYSLCGYGLLYYQNIVWLDLMLIFPLTMLGFLKLIKEKRSLLFTVFVTITIVLNYYLSYMVFLALILISALFLRYCVEDRGRAARQIGCAAFFSLGVSAPVWLPSLLQCFRSARTAGVLEELRRGGFFTEAETTLPVLLCSAAVVSIPVIIRLFPKSHLRKTLLLLLVLLSLPLIVEPINKLWHTGSYQAFPARYGYIPLFIGLWYFADCLSSLDYRQEEKEGILRQQKRYPIVLFAAAVHLLTLSLLLLFLNFDKITSYTKTLWFDPESLIWLLLISIHAASVIVLAIHFYLNHKISSRILAFTLVSICIIQGGFHASVLMGSAANFPDREKNLLNLEGMIPDDGMYRVKQNSKICDVNLLGAAGFKTLDHYTSLTDEEYLKTMKLLGYSSYWMETSSCCGTPISDVLLSNKYSIDENFQISATGAGNLAYLIPENILPEFSTHENRLEFQNAVFRSLTGKEGLTPYAPVRTEKLNISRVGETVYLEPDGEEGCLVFELEARQGETLYFDAFHEISTKLKEKINDTFAIEVNGVVVQESYPTQRCNGILELGKFDQGLVHITVRVKKQAELYSFGLYGYEEKNTELLRKQLTDAVFSVQGSRMEIRAEAEEGESLFLSTPYSPGMKITVNGVKTTPKLVWNCFLEIPLDKGENNVCVTYIPQGLWTGLWISSVTFLIAVFLVSYNRKKKLNKLQNCLERVSPILLNIAFYLVLAVIYILPVLLWIF